MSILHYIVNKENKQVYELGYILWDYTVFAEFKTDEAVEYSEDKDIHAYFSDNDIYYYNISDMDRLISCLTQFYAQYLQEDCFTAEEIRQKAIEIFEFCNRSKVFFTSDHYSCLDVELKRMGYTFIDSKVKG